MLKSRFLFFAILFISFAAYAQGIRLNIAVGEFDAKGVPASDVDILTDRLRSELTNTGSFRVMERSQMDEILKEQAFQQSGVCNTSECQVQVGQLLSVDCIVVGSIGLLGGTTYTINARLLDVGSGEVVRTANVDYQGNIAGVLSQSIPEIAKQLALKPGTPAKVVSKKATGTLKVVTNPPGFAAYLGETRLGGTPTLTENVQAGNYDLVLQSKEYLSIHIPVRIKPDSTTTVDTILSGRPKLTLNITPGNSLVELGDNSFPQWSGYQYVPTGPLTVRISKRDYDPYEETMEINQDLTKEIALTMPPPMSPKREGALVLAGASILTGLVGYYFDGIGAVFKTKYENATTRTNGEPAYNNMKDMESYRNLSYGVAVTSLVAAAVLWFWPEGGN